MQTQTRAWPNRGTCKTMATDKNSLDCAVKKATSKRYKTFKYAKEPEVGPSSIR